MIHIDVLLPRLFAEGATELQVQVTLESGSLTALVGPSGSGKTTLLRLLAGLETSRSGRITIDEAVWFDKKQGINLPPRQRAIGYVFQDTALFPNMTVRENITYAAPNDQLMFVNELIEGTGLEPFVDQKPGRLSGGQRQRVALARALVRRPQLLLLDEPFAALDTQSSQQLQQVLVKLHQRWQTTTLLVSHHDADVQALADRVIRLVEGHIQTDELIGDRPLNPLIQECITQIEYDENQQRWVVETTNSRVQSANPAWGQFKVGDRVQLAGITQGMKR
jgi:molybdate transport system ATP-binding protein